MAAVRWLGLIMYITDRNQLPRTEPVQVCNGTDGLRWQFIPLRKVLPWWSYRSGLTCLTRQHAGRCRLADKQVTSASLGAGLHLSNQSEATALSVSVASRVQNSKLPIPAVIEPRDT